MQMELAPFELPAGQPQHSREKPEDARNLRFVPNQPAPRRLFPIPQMPRARRSDVRTGNHLARQDRLGPSGDRIIR